MNRSSSLRLHRMMRFVVPTRPIPGAPGLARAFSPGSSALGDDTGTRFTRVRLLWPAFHKTAPRDGRPLDDCHWQMSVKEPNGGGARPGAGHRLSASGSQSTVTERKASRPGQQTAAREARLRLWVVILALPAVTLVVLLGIGLLDLLVRLSGA